MRWSLWSRGLAVVSHETALALHDLGDANPAVVHLTVPPSFRSKLPAGTKLHRAQLPRGDVWENEGFKVTTPLRTLLDVSAGTLDLDQLADAIQRVIQREPAVEAELLSRAEEPGPRAALRFERALRLGAEL